MNLSSAIATHKGLNPDRPHNEDSALALVDRGLYAVADGLGGHAAGEVASREAVEVFATFAECFSWPDTRGYMDTAFAKANHDILTYGARDPSRCGMGTTLTAAAIVGSTLHVAHAGDSACFLIRSGKAVRLTEDQSVGHRLLNCLGNRPGSFKGAQHVEVALFPGDVIVLATDGLTNYLATPQELARIAMGNTVRSFADALVKHALDSGGHDNVTVIVVSAR